MNCVLRTRIVKSIFVKKIRCQNCPHCSVCEGKWSLFMFVKENGLSSCVLLLSSLPDPFPPSSVPQSFSPSSEIAVWSLQKLQFLPSLFHISLPLLQELLHVDCKSCVRLPTLLHIPSLILFWNCSVEPTDTAVSPN